MNEETIIGSCYMDIEMISYGYQERRELEESGGIEVL